MKLNIEIPPSKLNGKMSKSTILDDLKKKYNDMHHKEHGYIIDVIELHTIVDTHIDDYTNHIILICECDVDVIQLKKGIEIKDCTISMILMYGIFLEYHKLNILIPATKLESFTFENDVFKRNDTVLHVGDRLTTQITDIQYSNQEYKCIGLFIEKQS